MDRLDSNVKGDYIAIDDVRMKEEKVRVGVGVGVCAIGVYCAIL